jgi:hypothetical protein
MKTDLSGNHTMGTIHFVAFFSPDIYKEDNDKNMLIYISKKGVTHMNHKIFSFVALLALSASIVANTEVTPTFVPRSQGFDSVRKMVGVSDKVHRTDEDGTNYLNFSALLGYTRSFHAGDIARCLFGDDLCCDDSRIIVQGSSVPNREANAWFADYFYLAPDYNSYFDIKPQIKNVIVDFDLFCGLNTIMEGLYLRIHGPINWTRWNLNFEQECDIQTTGSYDAGYFDSAVMFNNQLLGTFGDYAEGQSPLNTVGTTAQPSIGVEFQGLNFAKIDSCSHSRTGFAELRFELGYDMFKNECFDAAINVQVAAPTGSRTQAEFAFDPVVGNRKHWEVGGGLYGHYGFQEMQNGNGKANLYVDLTVMHLNKTHEQRTFDLVSKPNSRYMLAQRMNAPVNYLIAGASAQTPSQQFQSVFTPVANLTTLKIPVSIAVQADLVIMLDYKYKNWNFDLGYNFWGRSGEKFGRPQNIQQCCETLCDGSRNQWSLKGDAHVFGFLQTAISGTLLAGEPIALSATECGADIHSGTNAGNAATTCTGVNTLQNCGVDNAQLASATSTGGTSVLLVFPGATNTAGNQIQTSLNPTFINCCDINLQRTRGISNKVFGNINYTWADISYAPYIGIGFSAEFGKKTDCDVCVPVVNCDQQCDNTSCGSSCTECMTCSLSQWSVWAKGGISFE